MNGKLAAILAFCALGADGVESLPGWRSDFTACTNEAVQTHTPLVLVWGNKFCGHCAALEEDLQGANFSRWKADKEYIFCFVEGLGLNGTDPDYAPGARDFAATAGGVKTVRPTHYPFVTVYWNKEGGTVSATSFTTESALTVAKAASQYFAGWEPAREPDKFSFLPSGSAFDRLEAIETTKYVDVPIVRETADGGVATNSLVATWPGGIAASSTNLVVWTAGETRKTVRVPLARGDAAFPAGNAVSLDLVDGNGGSLCRSSINLVSETGNSVLNPKWTGEAFDYGEWTMDYEAAKKKDGHTLVMFSGVLWCPYCYGMETSLLASEKFTAWAKSNRVSLVLFDQGRASTPATAAGDGQARLLDYAAGKTSTREGGVASGAAYLSRKSIDTAAAREAIDRTTHFTQQWLAPGSTSARLGNPTILLVKDDKVMGRFTACRNAEKFYDPEENIGRLDDLLLLSDGNGDTDDYIQTTARTLAPGAKATCTFQINDRSECFVLKGASEGVWRIDVTNATEESDVSVALCTRETTLATGTGTLLHRITPDEASQTLYVRLTAYGDIYKNVCRNGASSVFTAEVSATAVPDSGTIALSTGDIAVRECETNVTIRAVRTSGSYGEVSATITADSQKTERYEWSDTTLVWADGEIGEKNAILKVRGNKVFEGRETITFRLKEVEDSTAAVSSDTATVTIYDSDKPSFEKAEETIETWTTFDAGCTIKLANLHGGRARLNLVSGSLPPGIGLSCDPETQSVIVKGSAKEAGIFTAKFSVSEKINGSIETGEETTVIFNVADPGASNPWLGKSRSTQTIALATPIGDGGEAIAGKLAFKFSAANQIKAKFAGTESKTYSFQGRWQEIDKETGTAKAELSSGETTLNLSLSVDGVVAAEVLAPADVCLFASDGGPTLFKGRIGAAEENVFAAYAGCYTMQMPVSNPDASGLNSGSASMILRMMDESAVKSGKMSYSALLPNGTTISGTSNLELYEETDGDGFKHEYALLPVFTRSRTRTFGACLRIKPDAADTWKTPNSSVDLPAVSFAYGTLVYSALRTEFGNEVLFHNVYGSYFEGGRTPSELCEMFDLGDEMAVSTGIDGFKSERYGNVVEWPGATLKASGRSFSLIDANTRFAGKYNASSGIVKFKGIIRFENGSRTGMFVGAAMPGWVDCNCGEDFVERPFAAGTIYFTDYIKDGGRWKAVRRSAPMTLDADGK